MGTNASSAGVIPADDPFEAVGESSRNSCRPARQEGDATALHGARDYISTLAGSFAGALRAAQIGDAVGFVDELERSRYFTGDAGAYRSAIASLAREFDLLRGPRVQAPDFVIEGVVRAFQVAIQRRG